MVKLFNWRCVYVVWPLEYLIKRHPVPTTRATVSLITVKCTALLHMLLVCTGSYLQSVLRYTFLMLYTYHPDTIYFCKQGCEDPWLFFEAKRGPLAKNLGKQ
jgi:hypothetical protein